MGNISFDQSQHSAASHLVSLEQVAQNEVGQGKNSDALMGDLAKEFMPKLLKGEQATTDTKQRLDLMMQTHEEAFLFNDATMFEQSKQQLAELSKAQENMTRAMSGLDPSKLQGVAEEMNKFFAKPENRQALNDLKNEFENTKGLVVPDSEIIQSVMDMLESLEAGYQTPYQKMTEALADMYAEMSSINNIISKVIGGAVTDPEDNTLTIDIKDLWVAIQSLEKAYTDPSSPIVQKLQSITFTKENRIMAEEMVTGTGLIIVDNPDGTSHLAVDPSTIEGLKTAFISISNGWPQNGDPNLAGSTVKITTFQLSSFQTSFESITSGLSSNVQTGTEKYRRVISTAENIHKLISSFIQANADANKGFLR